VELKTATIRWRSPSFGAQDRPLHVESMSNGLWRVARLSGVVATYRRDPLPDLMVGYELGRHRVRPDIQKAMSDSRFGADQ
jgi:hypothetical protein